LDFIREHQGGLLGEIEIYITGTGTGKKGKGD
jgi:hypothetical protein